MLKNVSAPFTIIATVLLMIGIAAGWVSIDLTGNTGLILLGVVVLLVIIEGRLVNKMSLLLPFMVFCMFLTASSELGTNQWINALLEKSGINPMIILVVITGLMAVGRFYAGPLVHRLNPTGVLLGSAIISMLGLYALSVSEGALFTMASAIVFAIGVCYFWPTMIGFVAEYVPNSGALGLSIMGGAGMVATSLVLPIMGESIDTAGPQLTLRYMTLLPAVLVVLFIGLYFYMRNRQQKNTEEE